MPCGASYCGSCLYPSECEAESSCEWNSTSLLCVESKDGDAKENPPLVWWEILLAVVIFLYLVFSVVVIVLIHRFYVLRKTAAENADVELNLPSCSWYVQYLVFFAFMLMLGLNLLIRFGTWVFYVAAVVVLVTVFGSLCCSRQYKAMSNLMSIEGVLEDERQIRYSGPSLHYTIRCWHIKITVHDDRRDIYNGYGQYLRTEGSRYETREEVTTFKGTRDVVIPYWCDLTEAMYIPDGFLLVHVMTTDTFGWLHGSERTVESIRQRIHRMHRHIDVNCDVTTVLHTPTSKADRMICTGDRSAVPMCAGWLRVLTGLLGFGLAVSVYVASIAPVVRHTVVKVASFVQPCVSPQWCLEHNVEYLRILPRAQVVRGDDVDGVALGQVKTEEGAGAAASQGSAPCVENPQPLIRKHPKSARAGAAGAAGGGSGNAEVGVSSSSGGRGTAVVLNNGNSGVVYPSYPAAPPENIGSLYPPFPSVGGQAQPQAPPQAQTQTQPQAPPQAEAQTQAQAEAEAQVPAQEQAQPQMPMLEPPVQPAVDDIGSCTGADVDGEPSVGSPT